MSGFFEEVQRRKVYRVAAAYVIAAGGIIQIASAVFPAWELPNWSLRLVIVLLLTGFPIALILGWAFDVTPQGIRATPKLESGRPSHRRRNIVILTMAGLLVSGAAGVFLLPRAAARKLDKSIAVLPFENLSDDKENAFFADGIQDDILTNLAKVGDLKVISRTSVMGYRDKPPSVREIGKALGVSAVLEGSVRRDKNSNRVRVNVQLINAANDQHLWAEDYDRDLTDIFAIQSDLAQKIANELQAQLSPGEKAQLNRRPTTNGDAYLAFVKAGTLHARVEDLDSLNQAAELYQKAVQLDPTFALAYARYSALESWLFHTWAVPDAREKARSLAKRALELSPDLPEAHLALGFSYYYGDQNFDAALSEFETAQRGLPNEMETYLALGAIKRRQGRWAESTADLEKAAKISPNDSWPLQNLAFNYEMLRDYKKANETLDRALQISPAAFGAWELKMKLPLLERGDVEMAEKIAQQIESLPASAEKQHLLANARAGLFLLARRWKEALQAAEQIPAEKNHNKDAGMVGKQMLLAQARKGLGDETGARTAFAQVKSLSEAQISESPANASAHGRLAVALAFLGEGETARSEANRAMELLPESKDAFEGPGITEIAATVSCISGDHAHAVELLEGLLARPSEITGHMLRIDPIWDPLRSEPAFQALLEKYHAPG